MEPDMSPKYENEGRKKFEMGTRASYNNRVHPSKAKYVPSEEKSEAEEEDEAAEGNAAENEKDKEENKGEKSTTEEPADMLHLTRSLHATLEDSPLNIRITHLDDPSEDEEDPPKPAVKVTCKDGVILFLKARGYWKYIKMTFKLVVHFLLVLLILFGSAVAFAYLEDEEFLNEPRTKPSSITLANDTSSNFTLLFWNDFESKYNLNLSDDARKNLTNEFEVLINRNKLLTADSTIREKVREDKMYIFKKWFYFGVIVATTIGYGDVTPKTEDGKMFYIFFSIVAIILVMSLLQRCGAFISLANRKVYGGLNRYVCRFLCKKGRDLISKEVLSLISILICLFLYLFFGIWYGHDQASSEWEMLDSIYFWVVTFTTVGFGEMTYKLNQELDNMPFFIIYRIFGLALVASVIDAIVACVNMDKINENREKLASRLKSLKDEAKLKAEFALSKADAALAKADDALTKHVTSQMPNLS